MEISKERLEEFKKIFKKEYGKELTDEEAYEYASNLLGFFKVLLDIQIRDEMNKQRLKKEPKGFALTGSSYSCSICGRTVPANEMWYDKFGQKCLICQKAIDNKIIPGRLCEHSDSWYSMWEFDHYFGIKSATVRKLIRQEIIKARIVPEVSCYVFIIKENTDILPPKKLLKSRLVRVGEDTFTSQYWYEFQDPNEVLKEYGILEYINIRKLNGKNYQ